MLRFEGKIALVTGGTKGIGRAIALRLASEGCDVAVNFLRNRENASKVVEEIESHGVRALAVRGNVGNEEHIARIFERVETGLGGLDFFISNAAVGALKDALEVTARDWEMSQNVIARALLLASQNAVRLMKRRGGGRIVAMTSMGSLRYIPDYTAVGAAKASLEALVRYLAVELNRFNIGVNAVAGGITDTESLGYFPSREQLIEHARRFTPSGRLTRPEDIAAVVAFLLSDDAAWIVGQTIVVDGGLSLF
jgi:enoyl-[acyl-carrier protein] reductase III